MSTKEQLQEIERALNFSYPASLLCRVEEFCALAKTASFQGAFPNARILLSVSEVIEARKGTPSSFLPFMTVDESDWPDVYGVDLKNNGAEHPILVWSDHAFVHEWENFPVFFDWILKFSSNCK